MQPGIVDWKIANRPPIKLLFRKVENCNQVISIGKKLKLSVVNIAGNDIVQGNRKLILGSFNPKNNTYAFFTYFLMDPCLPSM